MDLSFDDEDVAFRHHVRGWLRDNLPTDPRPTDDPGARAWDMAWQRRQFDGGFGGIAWPREYGGQGLPLVRQLIWFEEYARANGPGIGCAFVGVNHGGPTLIARGTEEQKKRHLPPNTGRRGGVVPRLLRTRRRVRPRGHHHQGHDRG